MESLQEKKDELIKETDNALYKYEIKKIELEKIEREIISYCEKQGHNWVEEIENGMYGERFFICKKCNIIK
jgi:hypothetical protein